MQDFPSFADAKCIGYAKGLLYYEKILNDKINGVPIGQGAFQGDTACLLFKLKTIFRNEYTEKLEVNSVSKKNNKLIIEYVRK